MLFNRTKEMQRIEETQPLGELGGVQGSIVVIVENLLDNVNFYTNTIEKLEKENKELRQFVDDLAQIVSGEREDMLAHMEAYLTSKSIQKT